MSTSGVNSGSGTNTSNTSNSAAASDPSSPAAQKDEFLQILLTQLQNQNPMDPIKPEDFATQLAQFSALEQQVDTNTKLDTLIANTGSGNISPVSYLGNTVTYSSPTAPLQSGEANWTYNATGASTITIVAKDASGNTVYTGSGDVSAGTHNLTLSSSQLSLPTGETATDGLPLTLTVTATDSSGNAVTPTITSQASITAVDSSSGTTSLEASGYAIPLTSVTQIQSNSSITSAFTAATTDFGNATSAFTSILNAITGS